MPNPYIENSERWKALSHIDYFTQFVKAWIPFNAWYKNYYPQLTYDSEIIEEIKNSSNNFKNKVIALLNGTDNDSIMFKNHVSNLHYNLERKYIYNKGDRVSFSKMVIELNQKAREEFSRYGVTYKAERNPSNWKNVKTYILDRNNNQWFFYEQTNGYNFDELKNSPAFQRLNPSQKQNLGICYESVNPYKAIFLLSLSDSTDSVRIGQYNFIHDREKITKGIITAVYHLRNALFHGEIVPDKETQKVYEPAYYILNQLIEAL